MKKIDYTKWLWFLIGFGLFAFTRTSTFIPVAIALAPVFILRHSASLKPLKSILLTWLGFILITEISLWTPIDFNNPFPGILGLMKNILLGSILALPFIVNRLLQLKSNTFISTLIFPVSAVAIYYLDSVFGPFGGVIIFYAYSQYGNLPLMQLLSVGGIWILIFLISWFSSVVCWLWDNGFDLRKTKKEIVVFIGIYLLLLVYGSFRVSPFKYDYEGKTVRIAAAVFPKVPGTENPGIDKILNERLFTPLEKTLEKIEKDVKKAALSGAKMIVFQEFSLVLPEKEEEEALVQLKRMTVENNIYICLGYVSMPELLDGEHKITFGYMELSDEEEEGRNMAVFIDNTGEIAAEYQKHHFVFGEGTWVLEGPGIIPVVETPYGKVGIAICRDMEFADYMRQAGKKQADIVLSPAYEAYASLSITYAQMLRSIENGFSFVRACGNGLSVAVDYHGRILSSMDYFTTSDSIMYADVPVSGVRTLYAIIGDILAWICLLALIFFIVQVLRERQV